MDMRITAQINGLKEDLEKENKKIKIQIDRALNYVASEMEENLRQHLWEDWHEKYFPKEYIRRTDNYSYGRPLGGGKNFHIEVKNGLLTFDYEPTGKHQVTVWYDRDGNDLIEWIQKEHGDIPPRPFWNNFIDEQINEKILENFVKGMSAKYKVEINSEDTNGLQSIAAESYLPQDFEE